MPSVRELLNQREAEIRNEIRRLNVELKEIAIARSAISHGHSSEPAADRNKPTIKQMVRLVLADQPNGLTSSEIIKAINRRFGVSIERTSLSPQLSRLGVDHEVALHGGRWLAAQTHLHGLEEGERLKPAP